MSERRRKGEVQDLVATYVNTGSATARLTPYSIALAVGITPGSAHAACKSLVRDGRVRLYGERPYMVGPIVLDALTAP